MHNLYAIFAKFLDICKMFSADLVNEKGNIPRRGVVPTKFSDLEVISLSLAAESIGIDSESFLFSKLNEYKETKKMTQLSYKLTSFYQQEAYTGARCLLYTSSITDKKRQG